MKKKALVLAISILAVVLLILGSLSQVVGYQFVQSPTLTDSISISMLDIPTIGHIPEDGVYWNNRKIAEYPVPFFLHYYFRLRAVFHPLFFFNIDNSSGINHVEYYLDDALIATIFIPPYEFEWDITVFPFSHSLKFGIKVYFWDGQIISDNITIYRLFP